MHVHGNGHVQKNYRSEIGKRLETVSKLNAEIREIFGKVLPVSVRESYLSQRFRIYVSVTGSRYLTIATYDLESNTIEWRTIAPLDDGRILLVLDRYESDRPLLSYSGCRADAVMYLLLGLEPERLRRHEQLIDTLYGIVDQHAHDLQLMVHDGDKFNNWQIYKTRNLETYLKILDKIINILRNLLDIYASAVRDIDLLFALI